MVVQYTGDASCFLESHLSVDLKQSTLHLAVNDTINLRQYMHQIELPQKSPTIIYSDNAASYQQFTKIPCHDCVEFKKHLNHSLLHFPSSDTAVQMKGCVKFRVQMPVITCTTCTCKVPCLGFRVPCLGFRVPYQNLELDVARQYKPHATLRMPFG